MVCAHPSSSPAKKYYASASLYETVASKHCRNFSNKIPYLLCHQFCNLTYLLACLLILIFHSIILYPFGMLLSACTYTVSVKPVNLATQPNDSKSHYNDLLPYTTHLFTRSHRTVSEHTSTVIWPKWTWSVQIYLIVKNVEIIVLRLLKSKH